MKKLICMWIGLVLCTVLAMGDDGMWLPHQMKNLPLAAQGLRLNPDDFYKTDGSGLASAIVNLGGGTGEFISAQGLILTNHHVAFGAIQRASSVENDYISFGFLAASREKEIPARGVTADVLLGYDDVTARVLKGVKSSQIALQRAEGIEKNIKGLIAAEESKGKDLNCTIRSMYSGNQYFMFRFKRLKDVRLVYAPPLALGNFGGEVDNWIWPRHTCDFSYYRAYVSKDNVGVEYSADNVPYQPKAFLKISLSGVKEGDFNFIIGFPGRTYRNNAVAEFQYNLENMTRRVKESKEKIAFYEDAGKGNRAIEIKYASSVKGLYNGLKNSQAKLEGLQQNAIAQKLVEKEKKLRDWIAANPARQKIYGETLPRLEQYMAKYRDFVKRHDAANSLTTGGPVLFGQAYTLFRLLSERKKPDAQRDLGFQQRDMASLKQRSSILERSYDMTVDAALAKWVLKKRLAQNKADLPHVLIKELGAGTDTEIDAFVDRYYSQTSVQDPEKRLAIIEGKLPLATALKDPMIALASELDKDLRVLREQSKAFDQDLLDLKKEYEASLLEMNGGRIASDANGTMRFTCGAVQGYTPRDAVVYAPFTTLKGVIEKDTGREPFDVPEKIKKLYLTKEYGRYADARLNDVVTCFINTTNVTGGNSGSPVLNAQGEQVGIIFDMTYESVIGDYFIIPELQRSIIVDIRYVMFVTDKFSGAAWLLKELGL